MNLQIHKEFENQIEKEYGKQNCIENRIKYLKAINALPGAKGPSQFLPYPVLVVIENYLGFINIPNLPRGFKNIDDLRDAIKEKGLNNIMRIIWAGLKPQLPIENTVRGMKRYKQYRIAKNVIKDALLPIAELIRIQDKI